MVLLLEATDLSPVLEEYHDLVEMFSKQKTLSLPPHHPYDFGTYLLPGVAVPSSHLYNLFRPEEEAMKRYAADSLLD